MSKLLPAIARTVRPAIGRSIGRANAPSSRPLTALSALAAGRTVGQALGQIGLGAALMYLLDPSAGRRRRALLRDQLVHVAHQATRASTVAAYDLGHRLHGRMARAREWLAPAPVSDVVLVERVRAHLGRDLSHPGAIYVTAQDRVVTLSGPVLRSEVGHLLAAAWSASARAAEPSSSRSTSASRRRSKRSSPSGPAPN